ncbi:MAG: extracellular solute-binding protein [Eubacteriales bacterium]|nr:extracellular solute-binding protein [Eubacteriales bacterium]
MKKKVLSMLLTIACAGMMTGTFGYADAPEGNFEGEIKVYAWTQMATALTNTAELFMEAHPEAKITVEQVDASYTKLYPELASGQGVADVFMVQNTDIQSFVNKYEGQIMDLTELITGEEDNFVASALRTCYDEETGSYYGVPIDIGPCALMYRTDIFEANGINVEEIKTWEDYNEAGKTILEATGGEVKMSGFDFNGATSQDYIKMLFAQQGGSYYNEDGAVNLASEEMIRAAETLNEMIDAGILMDFPNEWNDRITAIAAGQICTLPYPEWYSIVMKDSAADQAGLWAYAPMPSFDGENGNVCLGGSVLAASATSEYPELTKAFIQYSLMNMDCAQIMFEQGQFQAYKPFYEADCYQEVDDYFGISLGETFAQWVDSPEIDFGPWFTDVTEGLSQAIGEMFVNGVDPETALKAGTEIAQRAIDNQ